MLNSEVKVATGSAIELRIGALKFGAVLGVPARSGDSQ